jgi:hypothetical protein
MRFIVAILFCVVLFGCEKDQSRLEARVTFWQQALARDVPPGTTVQRINEWGAAHNIKFDYLEKQQWLYANVERVPVSGIHFPCSEWNIILKITVDNVGRSVKHDVSTVGSCV